MWWCVRAALRRDWRGLAVLTLVTALVGAVVLAALAGARRTDTAVARFLAYAGPFQGQVAADPATMDKIAALPGIAYSQQGALMLVEPVSVDGRPAPQTSVITEATITHPSQSRAIILVGRYPLESRADEVALNESAAQELHAHVGSLIQMSGYRPDQTDQVMNGTTAPPDVTAGNVRVTGIIRLPTDLTADLDAPADLTYVGQGDILATAAFFERNYAAVGTSRGYRSSSRMARPRVSWSWGRASSVRHMPRPRISPCCGRSVPIPGRAAASLVPGALVAVAGMALAVPAAYGLSVFTPIGLARRAEVSPGFSFDAATVLGGATVLAALLAGRAALAARGGAWAGARGPSSARPGARTTGLLTGRWLSP